MPRFDADMWKVIAAGAAGFIVALILFAVGREIVLTFASEPAPEVLGSAMSAIGSLRWIDTTLVTGMLAVAAAAISIREVRRQVQASAEDTQKQIDHAAWAAEMERDNKRDSVRVMLPLALSAICEYAEQSAKLTKGLLPHCMGAWLSRVHPLPEFPTLPDEAIAILRETIEFSDKSDRPAIARLVRRIQVQNARLRGLPEEAITTMGISRLNIESYICDSLLIYAQASDLFDFARYQSDNIPADLTQEALSAAFTVTGIHGLLRDELERRAWNAYRASL